MELSLSPNCTVTPLRIGSHNGLRPQRQTQPCANPNCTHQVPIRNYGHKHHNKTGLCRSCNGKRQAERNKGTHYNKRRASQ